MISLFKLFNIHVNKCFCLKVEKDPLIAAMKESREEVEDKVIEDLVVEKDIIEKEAEVVVIF